MSNRTTGAASTHNAEIADEQRWMNVIFVQGEEADTVLDMIAKSGPNAAIQHLSQWDYGEETRDAALVNGYTYDEIPESPTDRVVRDDASGYGLIYNRPFGYVSLLRHFDPVVEEPRKPAAQPPRFGLERQRTARRPNRLRL